MRSIFQPSSQQYSQRKNNLNLEFGNIERKDLKFDIQDVNKVKRGSMRRNSLNTLRNRDSNYLRAYQNKDDYFNQRVGSSQEIFK